MLRDAREKALMTRNPLFVGVAALLACLLLPSSAHSIDCCSPQSGSCCDTDTLSPPPGCVPTAVGCTGIFFLDARCEETIPLFFICDQDLDGDGFTPAQGDCDETDPAINPAAEEVCDLADNDCNGLVDEGVTRCGVGACERTILACSGGASQSCTPGDPMTEICDGVDNDCDGRTDEEEDLGSTTCGVGACERTVKNCARGQLKSCTPRSPKTEVCDGADNDCDGVTDEEIAGGCEPGVDNDGDGWVENPNLANGGDCDDNDPTINPGAREIPRNGVDEDCDGLDGSSALLLLPCDKQVSKWGTRLVSTRQRGLARCVRGLLDCQLECEDNHLNDPGAESRLDACRAEVVVRCQREIDRILVLRARFERRIRMRCEELRIGDFLTFVEGLGFELTVCGQQLQDQVDETPDLDEDSEVPDEFLLCLLKELDRRGEELVGELEPRAGVLMDQSGLDLDQSGLDGLPGLERLESPAICPPAP